MPTSGSPEDPGLGEPEERAAREAEEWRFSGLPNIDEIAQLIMLLGATYSRLQEEQCNHELTAGEIKRFSAIAGKCFPVFSGDPRGLHRQDSTDWSLRRFSGSTALAHRPFTADRSGEVEMTIEKSLKDLLKKLLDLEERVKALEESQTEANLPPAE